LQGGGLEHAGHALAIGGAVVDDGHALDLERIGGVVGQRGAQGVVVGDQAEGGLVTGLGQIGVGGRGGDVGQIALGVDGRRRDRGARLQVPDHAGHLGIAHLLGHGGGLTRIACVVFGGQLEADLLAPDHGVLGIGFFNRQTHAVFGVLADVGNAARDRAGVTDLHHLHVLGRHRGGQDQHRGGSQGGAKESSLRFHGEFPLYGCRDQALDRNSHRRSRPPT